MTSFLQQQRYTYYVVLQLTLFITLLLDMPEEEEVPEDAIDNTPLQALLGMRMRNLPPPPAIATPIGHTYCWPCAFCSCAQLQLAGQV